MPGTMARADLVADLTASLHDAGKVFDEAADGDFTRLLRVAALGLSKVRPRTELGSLTLIAGTASYPVPTDFMAYKGDTWAGKRIGQPWESTWPGRLPHVREGREGGVRKLVFTPAPTDAQISLLGSDFGYFYMAPHVIGDAAADTTVPEGERSLLLLRAQAEAMKELAMRGITKPVSLRDGYSGTPKNGTPSYLYAALLQEFEAAAC